jgi:hypothetical protein
LEIHVKLSWRRVLRWITWVLIALASVFWVLAIWGWLKGDPGFEPIVVLVSAVLSLLGLASGWLSKALENPGFTIQSSSIGLSRGGIVLADGEFSFSHELVLSFRAKLCVHNSGLPVSVRLRATSIGPDPLSGCLLKGISPEDINIKIRYRKQPNWASTDLGNPFVAEAGDRYVEIRAEIPFSVPKIEQVYRALASLKEMTITLEASLEGIGTKLTLKSEPLDLSPVHKSIEQEIVARIPKYPVRSNRPIDTQQLVLAMKRYWLGPEGTSAS